MISQTTSLSNGKVVTDGCKFSSHLFGSITDLPDATETVARGGQTRLKVFLKKLIEAPNLPASGDQVCSLKCSVMRLLQHDLVNDSNCHTPYLKKKTYQYLNKIHSCSTNVADDMFMLTRSCKESSSEDVIGVHCRNLWRFAFLYFTPLFHEILVALHSFSKSDKSRSI